MCENPVFGKTALALHWAHRARRQFPDGQLYVDLRGYDPDQPVAAGDVLARFLRALGAAGQDVPLDVEERAAAYRTLISGRRMLILLDNAASVEQLRPLLPGTRSCVVLVTSRDSLAGLVALHGARRVELEQLPLPDAVDLLRLLIGGKVEAQPAATVALAEQCVRLPLALRIAAELVATRAGVSLTDFVVELADHRRRLDLLDTGDNRAAMPTVLSWSYDHLPPETARAFRLLGLHPGPDLDAYALAALTDTGPDHAQRLLGHLARAHLIQATGSGRHSMHDLLRAYASSRTNLTETDTERQDALTRLFDHYRAVTAAAANILYPAERHRHAPVPPATTPAPAFADPASALAWLENERANLLAAVSYTAGHGWPRHTIHLAAAMRRYLDIDGYTADALTVATIARDTAHTCADKNGEAYASHCLAVVYMRQSRSADARQHLEHADTLYQQTGDRTGQGIVSTNLGIVASRQGHYELAVRHHRHGLAIAQEIDDWFGQGRAHFTLGRVYLRQGHYELAAEHFCQSLTLTLQTGDKCCEAGTQDDLGVLHLQLGRIEESERCHLYAQRLCDEVGYTEGRAYTLTNLGNVYRELRDYNQALEYHETALALFRKIGYHDGEVRALNDTGKTLHSAGQVSSAHSYHTAALILATRIDDRYEHARAHHGLAQNHHTTGGIEQARHHQQQALALYTKLGLPAPDERRLSTPSAAPSAPHADQ